MIPSTNKTQLAHQPLVAGALETAENANLIFSCYTTCAITTPFTLLLDKGIKPAIAYLSSKNIEAIDAKLKAPTEFMVGAVFFSSLFTIGLFVGSIFLGFYGIARAIQCIEAKVTSTTLGESLLNYMGDHLTLPEKTETPSD